MYIGYSYSYHFTDASCSIIVPPKACCFLSFLVSLPFSYWALTCLHLAIPAELHVWRTGTGIYRYCNLPIFVSFFAITYFFLGSTYSYPRRPTTSINMCTICISYLPTYLAGTYLYVGRYVLPLHSVINFKTVSFSCRRQIESDVWRITTMLLEIGFVRARSHVRKTNVEMPFRCYFKQQLNVSVVCYYTYIICT